MSGTAESHKISDSWLTILLSSLIALMIAPPANAAGRVTTAKSDYEIGAGAFKERDYAKAEKYFELGIRQAGSDPNLHYGLASVLQASGQNERARDEYRKCINLAPTSKLAEYSRSGLSFIDSKEMASAPPLPTPEPPKYSSEPNIAWHTPGAFSMPTSLAPGLPASTVQMSSNLSSGYSPGYSLPTPTPPAFGPGSGMDMYNGNFIGYMGRARGHHSRRFAGGYPQPPHYGSAYSPYAFGPPHTPVMEIRTYRQAPPLNVQTAQDQPRPIELMATQGKLVLDEPQRKTTGTGK